MRCHTAYSTRHYRPRVPMASMGRLERALALFVVVGWRIARLMPLGGTCHELDAAMLFESDQGRAAIILLKRESPATPLGLNEVIRLVATLAGFVALKGDGEPGVKTIRLGLQRMMDFAAGIRYVREIAHERLVFNGGHNRLFSFHMVLA